jgi:ribonuclease BN (tRNA processing enzyme)
VTHCHSDHVLGIMEFISKRNKAAEDINKIEKLFLVIPANVIPWFHHYCINIEDVSKGC